MKAIENYMTISEAADRYGISETTLKERLSGRTQRGQNLITALTNEGLIRHYKKVGAQRGNWIVTKKAMERWGYKEVVKHVVFGQEVEYSDMQNVIEYFTKDVFVIGDALKVEEVQVTERLATLTNEDEVIVYAVEIAESHEIMKKREGRERALELIVDRPSYEMNEAEQIIKIFETEEEAIAYAFENFEQIDVSTAIEKLFE